MDRRPFSQEGLKLVACAAMLIDHIGAYLLPQHILLRVIGRLAFPIYCFLLAEGICRSKNAGKYLLRMLLCLILSELPFDLCHFGRFSWQQQSVMVTLTLGLLMGLVMEKFPLPLKPLAVIPFALAAQLLKSDYGAMGVVIIALFLLTRQLPKAILLQSLSLFLIFLVFRAVPLQFFALAAMLPIALYSGRKTASSPAVRWSFYLFYPAHLLILWLIREFSAGATVGCGIFNPGW